VPNNVTNHVGIFGRLEDLKRIKKWIDGGKEQRVDFKKIKPMPKSIRSLDWHSWSCKNWGTKWNAHEITVYQLKPDSRRLVLEFNTAWNPPTPIFKEIVRKFPAVSIDVAVSGDVDDPFSFRVEPDGAAV